MSDVDDDDLEAELLRDLKALEHVDERTLGLLTDERPPVQTAWVRDTSPAESEQGSEWLSAFLSSASQRDAFADSLQSDVAEIESMIEQTKTLVVPRKSDERQHKEQLLQSMDDKTKADYLRREAERKAAQAEEARLTAERENERQKALALVQQQQRAEQELRERKAKAAEADDEKRKKYMRALEQAQAERAARALEIEQQRVAMEKSRRAEQQRKKERARMTQEDSRSAAWRADVKWRKAEAKRQLEVAKMEQEDKRAAAIRAEKLAIRRQRIHLEIQMMTAQDKLSKALSRADTLWRDEQKRRAEAEERRKKRMEELDKLKRAEEERLAAERVKLEREQAEKAEREAQKLEKEAREAVERVENERRALAAMELRRRQEAAQAIRTQALAAQRQRQSEFQARRDEQRRAAESYRNQQQHITRASDRSTALPLTQSLLSAAHSLPFSLQSKSDTSSIKPTTKPVENMSMQPVPPPSTDELTTPLDLDLLQSLGLADDTKSRIKLEIKLEQLTALDRDASKNFPSLRTLILDNNKLRYLRYLDAVPKLLSLSVCDNQLAQLSGLQSLSNLQTLLLNVNQIKSMRGLEMCANLKTLELANNQIENVEGLDSCSQLQTLSLYRNNIRELSNGLKSLSQLTTLDVGRNQLTELGTALSNCKLLVKLVAYENKIDKISPFNHTMLRELWLNGNHISELPHLGHLPLLEVLHLNDNKISVIHRDALSSCKLLKLVDVSFNSITDPSQLLLALQPCAASLQRISVNDNPFAAVASDGSFPHRSLLLSCLPSLLELDGQPVSAVDRLATTRLVALLSLMDVNDPTVIYPTKPNNVQTALSPLASLSPHSQLYQPVNRSSAPADVTQLPHVFASCFRQLFCSAAANINAHLLLDWYLHRAKLHRSEIAHNIVVRAENISQELRQWPVRPPLRAALTTIAKSNSIVPIQTLTRRSIFTRNDASTVDSMSKPVAVEIPGSDSQIAAIKSFWLNRLASPALILDSVIHNATTCTWLHRLKVLQTPSATNPLDLAFPALLSWSSYLQMCALHSYEFQALSRKLARKLNAAKDQVRREESASHQDDDADMVAEKEDDEGEIRSRPGTAVAGSKSLNAAAQAHVRFLKREQMYGQLLTELLQKQRQEHVEFDEKQWKSRVWSVKSWQRSQAELAAGRIQRWYRYWHASRQRRAEVERRNQAASTIGAWWRGVLVRRQPKYQGIQERAKAALARKTAAAIKIQAAYRGYRVRAILKRARELAHIFDDDGFDYGGVDLVALEQSMRPPDDWNWGTVGSTPSMQNTPRGGLSELSTVMVATTTAAKLHALTSPKMQHVPAVPAPPIVKVESTVMQAPINFSAAVSPKATAVSLRRPSAPVTASLPMSASLSAAPLLPPDLLQGTPREYDSYSSVPMSMVPPIPPIPLVQYANPVNRAPLPLRINANWTAQAEVPQYQPTYQYEYTPDHHGVGDEDVEQSIPASDDFSQPQHSSRLESIKEQWHFKDDKTAAAYMAMQKRKEKLKKKKELGPMERLQQIRRNAPPSEMVQNLIRTNTINPEKVAAASAASAASVLTSAKQNPTRRLNWNRDEAPANSSVPQSPLPMTSALLSQGQHMFPQPPLPYYPSPVPSASTSRPLSAASNFSYYDDQRPASQILTAGRVGSGSASPMYTMNLEAAAATIAAMRRAQASNARPSGSTSISSQSSTRSSSGSNGMSNAPSRSSTSSGSVAKLPPINSPVKGSSRSQRR